MSAFALRATARLASALALRATARLPSTLALRATAMCALTMLLATASSAFAQSGDWQIGLSPSFSSGRYGTETRTDIVYTPITARRLFDAGDVTVVVPFLCIRGNGGVTVVNGTPLRTDEPLRPAAAGTRGTATTVRAPAPAPVTTECGPGDLVLRGRYYLVDENGAVPTIAVRAHVKAPTASEEKGLGTGRPDEGAGIEISRRVGGVTLMADGGYTLIGKPDVGRADYQNSWWYDVGVATHLRGGSVTLSVFFEEYSSIVRNLPASRDVLATVMFLSRTGWRAQVGGQFGLSDGAPDHGVIMSASRRF
jgi:hypothetical protein